MNTNEKLELETKMGTLIAEKAGDIDYPGFTITLRRPDGKEFTAVLAEVVQWDDPPVMEVHYWTPADSSDRNPQWNVCLNAEEIDAGLKEAEQDPVVQRKLEELISSYDIIDFDGKQYVPVNDPMKSSEDWLIADAICLEDEPDDQGNWPRYSIEWELKGEPEDHVIAWGWWTPDCVLRMDGRYNIITDDLY